MCIIFVIILTFTESFGYEFVFVLRVHRNNLEFLTLINVDACNHNFKKIMVENDFSYFKLKKMYEIEFS